MTTHQIVQNWFTTGEAAAYCRISPRTLRRWTKAGRVRAYDGKYFRDDLDRAVRNEKPITPGEMVQAARRVTPMIQNMTRLLQDGLTHNGLHPGGFVEPPQHTGTNYVTQVMGSIPGMREAVNGALAVETAVVQLRTQGFARYEAEDIVQAARHLSSVSRLSFAEALERFSCTCVFTADGAGFTPDPDRPCPVHVPWRPISLSELRQMDEHGTNQPNERPEDSLRAQAPGCTCTLEMDPVTEVFVKITDREKGCPWHGERPYLACEKCNYDQHTCPGCGDHLKHGVEVCEECRAESAGSGGPENDTETKHGPGCNDGLPMSPEGVYTCTGCEPECTHKNCAHLYEGECSSKCQ